VCTSLLVSSSSSFVIPFMQGIYIYIPETLQKHHKPWFDEECSQVLGQRKQAKIELGTWHLSASNNRRIILLIEEII
jgi:hypothetical protein